MAQQSFDDLKMAMTQALVLALPDFNKNFSLQANASGYVMRAVMLQHGHPILYFSKTFCPKLQHSSKYVRDCMQ